MICPDPTRRIMADEAYHVLWKLTPAPTVDTPTFVRVAKGDRKPVARPKEAKDVKSTRKTRPVLGDRENEDPALKPAKSVGTLKRVRTEQFKQKEDTPPKDTQRELCHSYQN